MKFTQSSGKLTLSLPVSLLFLISASMIATAAHAVVQNTAVVYTTNVAGDAYTKGQTFTVDLAIKGNETGPLLTYAGRLFYHGAYLTLESIADVEMGGVPPALGPVEGAGEATFCDFSTLGNFANTKYNLTLCRFTFSVKEASSDPLEITVTRDYPNVVLIDRDFTPIPFAFDLAETQPISPAVVYTTNVQGSPYTPGAEFTVDVATDRSLSPVISYAMRVHYDGDSVELKSVSDVELGGTPPAMGPEEGEGVNAFCDVSALGNVSNGTTQLILCRLTFQVKATPARSHAITLSRDYPNAVLVDKDYKAVAPVIKNEATAPLSSVRILLSEPDGPTYVQGESFTIDVTVENNNRGPVTAYSWRALYDGDALSLTGVEDVDLGGMAPALGPVEGSGADTFRDFSTLGNYNSAQADLTLCRLTFKVEAPSATAFVRLVRDPGNAPLVDKDFNAIACVIDSPKWILPFAMPATMFTTALQGNPNRPGATFTMEVALKDNLIAPAQTYYFRVNFNSAAVSLISVQDVELGGQAPLMGPVESADGQSFREVSSLGNIDNEKNNLTLCRLVFTVNEEPEGTSQISIGADSGNVTVVDRDFNTIPVLFDNACSLNIPASWLYKTGVRGNFGKVGSRFTIDVAIAGNDSMPVQSHAFRVGYNGLAMELVKIEDVELGGQAPAMGPVEGDGADTWRDVSTLGNLINSKNNLILCRLVFQVLQKIEDPLASIWIGADPGNKAIVGLDFEPVPVLFDNVIVGPIARPDGDEDGKPDECETTDQALLSARNSRWTNAEIADSDNDRLLDGEEDPGDCGVTTETLAMTNPRKADTDGDGYDDGMEVIILGSDPLDADDPPSDNVSNLDNDGDGLPFSLDPDDSNPDVDGDGFSDGYEALTGADMNNPRDAPVLGDANGNGVVNNIDAVILFNFIIGATAAPNGLNLCDVHSNGVLNNMDAVILFNWALGNITLPFQI